MFGLSLEQWGAVGGIVGGVFAVIAFLFAVFTHFRKRAIDDFREMLSDPRDFAELRERFRGRSSLNLYFARIRDFDRIIFSYFGPIFSFKHYSRSLSHALIYPTIMFVFSWAMGSNGAVANFQILPNSDSIILRVYYTTVIVINSASFYVLYHYPTWTYDFFYKFITYVSNYFRFKVLDIPSLAALCSFFYVFLLSLSISSIGSFSYISVIVMLVSGIFAVSHYLSLFFILILIVIIGGTAFNSGAGAYTFVSLAIFCVILPITNAVFDVASWSIYRSRLKRQLSLQNSRYLALRIFWDAVFLAFISVLFAFFITIALSLCIELINHWSYVFSFNINIDWISYMNNVLSSPFNPNSYILIGMISSIFIPACLYASFGFAGIIPALAPRTKQALESISTDMTNAKKSEVAIILARATGIGWILSSVIVLIFYIFALSAIVIVSNYFIGFLPKVILWATCWSHGQCPTW